MQVYFAILHTDRKSPYKQPPENMTNQHSGKMNKEMEERTLGPVCSIFMCFVIFDVNAQTSSAKQI